MTKMVALTKTQQEQLVALSQKNHLGKAAQMVGVSIHTLDKAATGRRVRASTAAWIATKLTEIVGDK